MSYRLEAGETPAQGVKRIAIEQIDQALEQLATPSDGDRDEAVHDARKRFKKIRAVLRLVRKETGEKAYRKENVFYRDLGRELSAVRDSFVMVETLDRLSEDFADQLPPKPFAPLREHLVAAHQITRQQLLEEEERMAKVAADLQEAKLRVPDWPVQNKDFSAFRGGLKKVYKRGCKGMKKSYDNPKVENFHDWRKRIKYLWYHTRILKPIWPAVLDELADELHNLSDYLGDDHDYAVLRATILNDAQDFCTETERQALLAIIDQQRTRLEAKSRPLARRIYTEKPGVFVRRIERYWRTWQTE